jgi:hypothetical protein
MGLISEVSEENAALRQFKDQHAMGSCTNPTCDCIESRLHRTEAVYEIVTAPSPEDLEALSVIWDAIQGCNDERTEDVHAFLAAIAARASGESGERP